VEDEDDIEARFLQRLQESTGAVVEGDEDLEDDVESKYLQKLNQFSSKPVGVGTDNPRKRGSTIQESDEPNWWDRTKGTMQSGLTDAIATVTGESAQPSYRDQFGKSPFPVDRLTRALGENILPAVGDVAMDAVSTIAPDVAKRKLSNTLAAIEENKASHPIYAGSDVLEGAKEAGAGLLGEQGAENLGTLANVASVAAPQTLFPKASTIKVGDRLSESARKNRIQDIARRWEPENVIEARGRAETQSNPLARDKYNPSPSEAQMYEDLATVDNLNERGSYKDSYYAIDDRVEAERTELDDALRKEDYIDSDVTPVVERVEDAWARLDADDVFIGDAERAGRAIFNKFNKLFDEASMEGYISPADLLQIRRDLDQWVDGKRGKVWDADKVGAEQVALKEIRSVLNDVVANHVKSPDVKESLRYQHSLLNARDQIAKPAAAEGKTRLGRFVERSEARLGLSSPKSPRALASNVTDPLAAGIGLAAGVLEGGTRAARRGAQYTGTGLSKAMEQSILASRGPLSLSTMTQLTEEEEEPQIPYRR
jgi:hypothetical protein